MIPSETVDLVRERVDIVDVIGDVVELRRTGVNYKGLCPFHQEKTPSFNVNQARQMYHCFGCGVGGDVFSFVMEYEGRTFADAVRTLAARVGVVVEEEDDDPRAKAARTRRRSEKERLLSVMEAAADFFARQLESEAGRAAREYLAQRGIAGSMIRDFSIGYAPAAWDGLSSSLKSLGVSPSEAERVGLLKARQGRSGYYDRFRDRIIFPVHDAAGRVIAFGGRVMPGAPKDAPKYVNSPESPIFSKSKTLYGLHRAREGLRRREVPIIVEGNVDVIAMHAHGFTATVAPMGTALTVEQVELLRRFAGRDATVVLLFDGDDAGRQAAHRAQPALAEAGLGARVALLPPSEDPDSYLRRHGAESLAGIIDRAEGLVEHLIAEAARAAGPDAHSKTRAIRSLAPVVASVTDPLESYEVRRLIAREFGVDEKAVLSFLRGGGADASPGARFRRPESRSAAEGTVVSALLDVAELIPEAMAAGARDLVRGEMSAWVLEKLDAVSVGALTMDEVIAQAPNEAVEKRIRAHLVAPSYTDIRQARRALEESLERLRALEIRERVERLDREIEEAKRAGDAQREAELAQQKLLAMRGPTGSRPDRSRRG